jgi:hypothetical protein
MSDGIIVKIKGDASSVRTAFTEAKVVAHEFSQGAVTELTVLGKKGEEIFNKLGASIGLSEKALTSLAGAVPIAGVALAGLGVVAFELGEKLLHTAENAAKFGNELYLASQKTGLSVETLSALKVAAEESGSSLEQVSNGIYRFTLLLGSAAQSNDKAIEKLKDLHVTAKDLDTAFAQVVERIYSLKNPVDRATAAGEAFGKKFGKDIIPIINEFKGDLPGLIEHLDKMGLLLKDKDAVAAHEFEVQMGMLHRQFSLVARTIGFELIPVFKDMASSISGWLVMLFR